ncbi:TPA: hypothetical protein LCR10_004798 [Salmonella enterica subsp. enterica serovar Hvittingfoss]|nr:hypothetical protein [Salmonella enterica]HBJ5626306.1 hypothetical protein [Salmonella enterica subsp. enterica serovar Hvittingfoss]
MMIATLTLEALKSNFLFSSEFNFHVKDIGDAHEKSSIFKDDGYTSFLNTLSLYFPSPGLIVQSNLLLAMLIPQQLTLLMNNSLVINPVNTGHLKNGGRDTVRYTEDKWPLQNLFYGLRAKFASVIQPFGNYTTSLL